MGKKKSHDKIEHWSIAELGDEGEMTGGPTVTQDDLDHGGEAAGGHGDHGVVPDLLHAGVDWVHLVLVQLHSNKLSRFIVIYCDSQRE